MSCYNLISTINPLIPIAFPSFPSSLSRLTSMGGGAAMRAAAKVAGIGVVTGGIRGGVASETLASRKTVRPASVSSVGTSSDQTGALRIEQAVQKPVWEIDDWDFAGCSDDDLVVDRINPIKPRLVFGPVPTLDEAKAATSELKDALDKVFLSSPKSSGSMDSTLSAQETKACITQDSSVPKSAMQAFKLLKESPAAQTVVASIACDPNVWNAVMQNPTLVDFLESERECANFEVHDSPKSSTGSTSFDGREKPDGLMAIFEDVKRTVLDMVNNLSNFVQSLFAEPDAGKKAESSEGTARSLFAGGSFMALAMMVVMVVVMKRV